MFGHDVEHTVECPRCGATTTADARPNSRVVTVLGACNVCGYERSTASDIGSRTKDGVKKRSVSIPLDVTPREGVRQLAENAGISVSDAVDVLDPDTDTKLKEVQSKD